MKVSLLKIELTLFWYLNGKNYWENNVKNLNCFFLILISAFSLLISTISLAQLVTPITEAKKICEEVGEYIYNNTTEKNSGWILLNSPRYEVRDSIIQRLYEREYAEEYIESHLNKSNIKALSIDDAFNIIYQDSQDVFSFSNNPSGYAMIESFKLFNSQAVKALKIADLHYKNQLLGSQFSQLIPKVWVDVYTDSRYVKPLLALVQSLHKQYYQNNIIYSDIEKDLRFFIKKFNPDTSNNIVENMAWNILGIYGSQGPFLEAMAEDYDALDTGIGFALAYLSYLISAIDARNIQYKLYSLPNSIKTKCVIGKPYHFWMSAFLAYKLRIQNNTARKSSLGSYDLGSIYLYIFGSNGRSNKTYGWVKEILNNPNSIILNDIRLSHALHAAGAVHGACLTTELCVRNTVDMDKLIDLSLKEVSKVDMPPFKFYYPNNYYKLMVMDALSKATGKDIIFQHAFGGKFNYFPN